MQYPYNKKFMNDKDFISLLKESCCQSCEAGEEEQLMQNLAKIHEYSGELMGLMGDGSNVEEWIVANLANASKALSDVKHYIEYRKSAYGMHMGALESHGDDINMSQRDSVAGRPEGQKMPVMTQNPVMTPPSSMAGMPGNDSKDFGDDIIMVFGSEEEEGEDGDDVEISRDPVQNGMSDGLPDDEDSPIIKPTNRYEDEDGVVISLSEIWK